MDISSVRRIEGFAYLALYAACIPLANWLIGNVGTFCAPMAPA